MFGSCFVGRIGELRSKQSFVVYERRECKRHNGVCLSGLTTMVASHYKTKTQTMNIVEEDKENTIAMYDFYGFVVCSRAGTTIVDRVLIGLSFRVDILAFAVASLRVPMTVPNSEPLSRICALLGVQVSIRVCLRGIVLSFLAWC
jgi:hypothetical protein